MNETRFSGMLGFAMRAGKLIIGSELVCRSMAKKRGEIKLLLIAGGASDATKKRLTSKAEFYSTEYIFADIGLDTLARLIGKEYTPACVGITDDGFAAQIKEALKP